MTEGYASDKHGFVPKTKFSNKHLNGRYLVELVLQRTREDKYGTHGQLYLGYEPLRIYTIEEPWLENRVGISCIPAGSYWCTPHSGTKFKDVWILNDVPNRSAILIHAGNTIEDTRGCILVGLTPTKTGVGLSRAAIKELHQIVGQSFFLHVRDAATPESEELKEKQWTPRKPNQSLLRKLCSALSRWLSAR